MLHVIEPCRYYPSSFLRFQWKSLIDRSGAFQRMHCPKPCNVIKIWIPITEQYRVYNLWSNPNNLSLWIGKLKSNKIIRTYPAGIAQSVQQLATGWMTEGSEFESHRVKYFLSSTSSIPALGLTQPPYPMGTKAFPPRVKWPGRDANHSHPTSAEVRKM
jgi:hypothetical protein